MLMQDWDEGRAAKHKLPAGSYTIQLEQDPELEYGTNSFTWGRALHGFLPVWSFAWDIIPKNDENYYDQKFIGVGFMDDFGDFHGLETEDADEFNEETCELTTRRCEIPDAVWELKMWLMLNRENITGDWDNNLQLLSTFGYESAGWVEIAYGTQIKTWDELPKERGWEALLPLASTDGMLCVRWLNWYEQPPVERSDGTPVSQFYPKLASRQVQFEGVTHRSRTEVAAEVFPVEIGSIQSRTFNEETGRVSVGLVLDWDLTDIRQVFSRDCWSEREGVMLAATRRKHECYSQAEARQCYESVDPIKRWAKCRHTEAFVGSRKAGAVVVYGGTREKFEHWMKATHEGHLVHRLKRQGLPVVYLETGG